MGWRSIWQKLIKFRKKDRRIANQGQTAKLSRNLAKNQQLFQEIFQDCGDISFHEFKSGSGREGLLLFQQGLVDKKMTNQFILQVLLEDSNPPSDPKNLGTRVVSTIGQEITSEISEIIEAVLTGKTALIIDGSNQALILETTGWEKRGIEEPKVEIAVRGPRDGFIESIQTNIGLVRRRLKDTRVKVLFYPLGRRSKTKVALMYMAGVTPPELLREVQNRLERVDMDIILDAGYLEQMIEDKWFSIFPQLQMTERPDEVVAALAEGRVAIFTDNSPGVLMAPVTLNTLMHAPDDYYTRWILGSFIRSFRFAASIFSIILPALYVALTSFHPELLPTQLALSIASARQGLPYPAFMEAFVLEAFIELVREAGLRLPGNLGQAIGIVGALIIGQAAVNAKLVTPTMLTVVGLTAISNFTIPNFETAQAIRVIRFLLMILAGIFGLYGVSLGIIILLSHLSMLKSFGYSYLSPWSPLEPADLKDSLVRFPWPSMHRRPRYLQPRSEERLEDERRDHLSKSNQEED